MFKIRRTLIKEVNKIIYYLSITYIGTAFITTAAAQTTLGKTKSNFK